MTKVSSIHSNEEEKKVDSLSKDVVDKERNTDETTPSISEKKIGFRAKLMKELVLILVVLTVAVLINLYFISPFSKLQKIELSGLSMSTSEQVIKSSNLKIGEGIWSQYFSKNKTEQKILDKNPRIKSVKLQLASFDRFKIKVKEYKTIGFLKKDNKFHAILENERILKEATNQKNDDLPTLINFKEDEVLASFLKVYHSFDDTLKSNVLEVESNATDKNPYRITLKMKDGNQVIALSTTVASKIKYYDKIVAEMKGPGVIDMEAGTSGIFSYENQENKKETEQTTQTTQNLVEEWN